MIDSINDSSIRMDESIKTIRIKTIIPFSFPSSLKMITLKVKDNLISVYFETINRSDIFNQLFPQSPLIRYIVNGKELPNFDPSKNSIWMPNDRFGQRNYMFVTFYFWTSEKSINEIEKAIDKKYLPLCADAINLISTGYRLLTNAYFPRNFTKNDIMAYHLAFSKNKNDFSNDTLYSNTIFNDFYPDDKPTIDINDFLKYASDIPVHIELIINSEDYFMEKNYRMTVIEADTATESLLYNILKIQYNTFPPNVQNKVTLDELLTKRLDDLKEYLNYVSPKITSGLEWSKWKTKCHKLRNDVVHKRKSPALSEAEEALSSAKELLELLKDFAYDENDWLLEGKGFIHNRKKAKSCFEKSISKKPNANAFYYLGNIDFEDRKFNTARQYYEEALKYAEHPFFYYNIGSCYRHEGLFEDAIAQYDIAIDLDIEVRDPYHNPYYQKLLILIEQKFEFDPNDIIILLNVLLEAFPYNTEFLILRAKYALKVDQNNAALDDIQKAININGNIRKNIEDDVDFSILKNEERFKNIMRLS